MSGNSSAALTCHALVGNGQVDNQHEQASK